MIIKLYINDKILIISSIYLTIIILRFLYLKFIISRIFNYPILPINNDIYNDIYNKKVIIYIINSIITLLYSIILYLLSDINCIFSINWFYILFFTLFIDYIINIFLISLKKNISKIHKFLIFIINLIQLILGITIINNNIYCQILHKITLLYLIFLLSTLILSSCLSFIVCYLTI